MSSPPPNLPSGVSAILAAMGLDPNALGGDDLPSLAELLGALSLSARSPSPPLLTDEERTSVFGGQPPSLDAFVGKILSGELRNVIVLAGAGLSVAAGVPDFRSDAGLYAALAQYDLPFPEAVFELDFFRSNPRPFYALASAMFSETDTVSPTLAHWFLRLLHDRGLLLRVYTQNIDGLEADTGLPDEVVIPVHGSFVDAHCIDCGASYEIDVVKTAIRSADIPRCAIADCAGLIKPAIVFFGESLPETFFEHSREDVAIADAIIVMGTSLTVQPVASLPSRVSPTIPRLLINRERVGDFTPADDPNNYRDVLALGNLDDQVVRLCHALGPDWSADLASLAGSGSVLDKAAADEKARAAADAIARAVAATTAAPVDVVSDAAPAATSNASGSASVSQTTSPAPHPSSA
ncbi:Sir2 family histone deacetylase Hst2 [Thecamonas trahens ATCC 50062]|uniref:Sir2 family histone deacetylase Hst2 n=1 Tax=Thecamonas trahens ATCC 50062 TaxID=461836 RepID=A0A0L0D8W2_THETB|nr:Sir2 family histone deacetylase Hst2 [Thecamonas trahens ATCC 50062]KNC48779.1 Sir2 family histone deacetylase Hst2 [Thecamonas trahens ATCC 50062]|eukprot:XP_013762830.1 Sir2 family histone deacetylase Hst2 [Thecamonas trahens ATCC 50062]